MVWHFLPKPNVLVTVNKGYVSVQAVKPCSSSPVLTEVAR